MSMSISSFMDRRKDPETGGAYYYNKATVLTVPKRKLSRFEP